MTIDAMIQEALAKAVQSIGRGEGRTRIAGIDHDGQPFCLILARGATMSHYVYALNKPDPPSPRTSRN